MKFLGFFLGMVLSLSFAVAACPNKAKMGEPEAPDERETKSNPGCPTYPNETYGKTPQERADIYMPSARGLRPAVIIVHGGGWAGGSKVYPWWYATEFARRGIVAVSINYRLYRKEDPSSIWPAQIQDVQLAVRWLRANARAFNVDPKRICALGDSAGGHLSLLLGSLTKSWPGDRSSLYADQSPQVSCVVDLFGPTDLSNSNFNKGGTALVGLFGGKTVSQAPELYAKASPVNYIGKQSAATLIFQGDKDLIVPPAQSQDYAKSLEKAGVRHELWMFSGGHWQFDSDEQKRNIDAYTFDWVRKFLQP